ncbi:MAG: hypothetical protein WAX85_02565 [Minisyncoccia bacterium]
MALSAVTGITSPVTVKNLPKIEASVTESSLIKKPENKDIENMMSTEEYVREYFSDIPIMIDIARCESTFRHLDNDGDIHRGRVNRSDVGVMQINEHYHLDESVKEDYDIYTIEGNTSYARKLYEEKGTQPWASSKACWGKSESKDLNNLALNK